MTLEEFTNHVLCFEPGHHGREWRIHLAEYIYVKIHEELAALHAEVEKWKDRFEEYSLRLAGCGVVASGGSSEEEIEQSADFVASCPTIRAVLCLRAENERFKKSHENMEKEIQAHLAENEKLKADAIKLRMIIETFASGFAVTLAKAKELLK